MTILVLYQAVPPHFTTNCAHDEYQKDRSLLELI